MSESAEILGGCMFFFFLVFGEKIILPSSMHVLYIYIFYNPASENGASDH